MCQLYVCRVPCLEELLKVHLESIFELIRSILSHYVLPGSSKTKKASVPLNRAILGTPLPYPAVLLDERIPERNEKGCRHWENSIVATICDRNHCIGPYHRLLADATPRKVSKRRKKLVTKKVDSFVLFYPKRERNERSSDLSCKSFSVLPFPFCLKVLPFAAANSNKTMGTLRILMAGICTKWMSFNIQCKHMSKNSRRGRDDDDPLFDIEKPHCLNKYCWTCKKSCSSLQNFQV